MSVYSGPGITTNGLVLALDPSNAKSALRKKQTSNILVDPNTWSLGTGGTTGYGANGTDAEQLRAYVTDDPWGGNSIVWRTVPDGLSEADGGWNSSYYAIDRSFTYRWSVWVRRHTAGTGGTFYFGMNPAPIRNDTGLSQSNPYFNFPAQASLTLNQWYLVVGHCFYQGYSGGRHPDSGWYANGAKISDIAFGNVGTEDVRWDPSTTTAMHRTYHYYTTNTASGLEFAYPRLDKCDDTQPSIQELLNVGESKLGDLSRNSNDGLFYNGVGYNYNNGGYFTFDGSNDFISTTASFTPAQSQIYTISAWFRTSTASGRKIIGIEDSQTGTTSGNYDKMLYMGTNGKIHFAQYPNSFLTIQSTNTLNDGNWHNATGVYNGTNMVLYIDGISNGTLGSGASTMNTNGWWRLGSYKLTGWTNGGDGYFTGDISIVHVYHQALSASGVLQNFNAFRGRFGI